ncbi:hypothetical protein CALCODRAFT_440396 [Calocera cornea HHB12733]|uniref:Uncharacterized protein n=1 Tax=Calocera cornea HHB12733 TaxID=1353952 RepID=A0A165DPQ8_9BASI|nr:hypothetical protein CALCODRAFT_440396 [Calocera cornea HHB12733]
MIISIINRHEGKKTEDLAKQLIGKRVFLNWPFLQEGLCVAVSDEHFKHEEGLIAGKKRIVAKPQSIPDGWRRKADRIEHIYSKRYAVLTSDVEVLVHVRPLRGLKRLDDGALVKDYEDADKEVDQAVQLAVTEVFSEDQRFLEKEAPPLSEEFPAGSKVIFLGEHAYGVAAQVKETTDTSLTVVLAFFPNEKAENDQFTRLVNTRPGERYQEAHVVSRVLGMSGLAFAKITSSLMVITKDGQKTNIGLSLKFEAKGMKVLGYTRKGRTWEFSEKAIQLIREYKQFAPELFQRLDQRRDDLTMAQDLFPNGDSDARVKEIRGWLNEKGIRDLEPVSLLSEQLDKDTVGKIEQLANQLSSSKSADMIKKALVKGIPRQAVLKPSHAVYRLLHQRFALGDRVTMVQDAGSVPLTAKGVVVGLNTASIDVVWDVPFMSGSTFGGRCSQYRGSTVSFNTCLNLSHKQYVMSTNPTPPPAANGQANQRANGHTNGAAQNGGLSHPVNAPYGAVRGFAPVHVPRGGGRGRGVGRGGPSMRGAPPVHLLPSVPFSSAPQQPVAAPGAFVDRGRGRGHGGRGGFRGAPRGRGGYGPAGQAQSQAQAQVPAGQA